MIPFNHTREDSVRTPCTICLAMIDAVLVRLRVELYTAAQVLTGEQLDDFDQLLKEVRDILDQIRRSP